MTFFCNMFTINTCSLFSETCSTLPNKYSRFTVPGDGETQRVIPSFSCLIPPKHKSCLIPPNTQINCDRVYLIVGSVAIYNVFFLLPEKFELAYIRAGNTCV